MADSSGGENPVLTAYNGWAARTPFASRFIMTSIVVSWIASFFLDVNGLFANSLLATIYRLEIYRLITAGLYCDGLLNLIFSLMSFNQIGPRLESAHGSTGLLALLFTFDLLGNCAFLGFAQIMTWSGQVGADMMTSASFWNVLIALIAIECMGMPEQPRRFFFFPCTFPSKFYPLVLYGAFCLIGGGIRYDMGIFLALAYAYSYGKLDRFKPSRRRIDGWESGCLANFTGRPGYIVGGSAVGGDAWLPVNNPAGHPSQQQQGGGGGGFSSIFGGQQTQQPGAQGQGQAQGGQPGGQPGQDDSSQLSGAIFRPKDPKVEAFAGAGHSLGGSKGGGGVLGLGRGGGAAPKDPAAARAARLAALERGAYSVASEGTSERASLLSRQQEGGGVDMASMDAQIAQLQDMGYSGDSALAALSQTQGDVSAAVALLSQR